MNYYQFFIGDYRRDTVHLTLLEHGVYRQLIDWYYLEETPIPKITEVVMRRLCAKTDDEVKAVNQVLSEYFELTEKGYIHCKCDKEIAAFQSKVGRARTNGKLGGRPLKTEVVISGLSNQNPRKTHAKPTQKLPITHNPINKDIVESQNGFALFWSAYPKHTARLAAIKAFEKQKINGELTLIISDIEAKKQSDGWRKDGGQYIPNPATYLNQRRWEDESATAPVGVGNFI